MPLSCPAPPPWDPTPNPACPCSTVDQAFTDLSQLMRKAEEMVQLAQYFRERVAARREGEPAARCACGPLPPPARPHRAPHLPAHLRLPCPATVDNALGRPAAMSRARTWAGCPSSACHLLCCCPLPSPFPPCL